MIVEEKKFKEKDGSIGFYDGVYDSSNILQTTYFPKKQTLYISFKRGGVYSYSNVPMKLYEEFKNAESQGKFFAQTIKKQPEKYHYRKEFTLYPAELNELEEVVEKNKEETDPDNDFIVDVEPNKNTELNENEIGLVQTLLNVLSFYGDKENYEPYIGNTSNESYSKIDIDNGEQARKAIELAVKIKNENEKMKEDYESIIKNEMKNANNPEAINKIINAIKNNQE